MKPKIIQVTAIGMSQVKLLAELNKTLINDGFEVHAICGADGYEKQIKDAGVIFHDVKIDRSINLKENIKSVIAMMKIFKEVKPDIVHVHTPVAAVLGRIAARLSGVPNIIYTAHGFYFHEGMNKRTYNLFYLIEKYIGRFCTDYIFTQSKEDYELAVKGRFLNNDNYLHISNGIDLTNRFNDKKVNNDELRKLKTKLGIDEQNVVFSFLGRMVKEKGVLELLEAFVIMNKAYPEAKLICMGSMPASERDQSTYEEVIKYNDQKNIIFTGQVESPELYYAISDVFVLPSYREGMPRSIIEAMAMHNAIIATNIRGSREEVTHGDNGYLVNVQSVYELVIYMKYLTENQDIIERMKQSGYKKTIEEYNENTVVMKQLDVFNKLLEVGVKYEADF